MYVHSLRQTDHTRQEVFEQRLAPRLTARKGDKLYSSRALNISYLWDQLDTFNGFASFFHLFILKQRQHILYPSTHTDTMD